MSNTQLKLTALTKENLLVLLKKGGSRKASPERLEADIAAGAPVNAEGTINLIEYIAWLVRENNGI
jgi:hypothetical protein